MIISVHYLSLSLKKKTPFLNRFFSRSQLKVDDAENVRFAWRSDYLTNLHHFLELMESFENENGKNCSVYTHNSHFVIKRDICSTLNKISG